MDPGIKTSGQHACHKQNILKSFCINNPSNKINKGHQAVDWKWTSLLMKNGQIIWRALFDLWGEKRLWHLKINRVPAHNGWKISSYNVDIKYMKKVTINEVILEFWLHRINERSSHWATVVKSNVPKHQLEGEFNPRWLSSPRWLSDSNEQPLSPHLINPAQLPSNPNNSSSPKHTKQLLQEVWHLPVGRVLTEFRNEGGATSEVKVIPTSLASINRLTAHASRLG